MRAKKMIAYLGCFYFGQLVRSVELEINNFTAAESNYNLPSIYCSQCDQSGLRRLPLLNTLVSPNVSNTSRVNLNKRIISK